MLGLLALLLLAGSDEPPPEMTVLKAYFMGGRPAIVVPD